MVLQYIIGKVGRLLKWFVRRQDFKTYINYILLHIKMKIENVCKLGGVGEILAAELLQDKHIWCQHIN